MVTLADLRAAQAYLAGHIHRTPTVSAASLGAPFDIRLLFKAELFQKTGSFKVRGVLNKLRTLTEAERARGLVSLSAGNHAQALAWGASHAGTHAVIVMPAGAVTSKIDATRGYAGEVVLTDRPLLEVCRELQEERQLTLVHPFDDPLVIAGAGTVGLEIVDATPDAATVLVPIGGGGLASGVAAAVKHVHPAMRVIGVEPEGSDVMAQSLAAGRPVQLEHSNTVADGLAAPFAGEHTFAHVRRFVDGVVRVSDEAVREAMRLILQRAKLAAEPAGAAAYAALLEQRVELEPGQRVVCIVSGGNVDIEVLKQLL
jgi:threonine dehydratase